MGDAKRQEDGVNEVVDDFIKQVSDDEDDEINRGLKETSLTTTTEATIDEAVSAEDDLLDLTKLAPKPKECIEEEYTINTSPTNDIAALGNQDGDDDNDEIANNDESNDGRGGRWGLFRRMSSRNGVATTDGMAANHMADVTEQSEKAREMDTDTEKKTVNKKQQQGQRRRRRWGLGQVQSNNSDSENELHKCDDDRKVEEDYDGVVVDEHDGSDGDGVRKTVILDAGGGLRTVKQESKGDEYDGDKDGEKSNETGDGSQRRYWVFRRNNRQEVNNDDDDDNDEEEDDGSLGDSKNKEENEQKSNERREDETLQRFWSFRRGPRQQQQ
eukprot:8678382-Ditylum_brightwellii.AAC.1